MIRVALTHDVDRVNKHYQYFTHSLKYLLKLDVNKFIYHIGSIFRSNPYWNFEKIIRIEEEYGVKSTFFFMHETIKFEPFNMGNWKLSLGRYKLTDERLIITIQWLDEGGWEIGLHGSYLSFKNFDLLRSEKEILEKIIKHPVLGIRQHYLNLGDKTWEYQKKLGFKYDSSFGYHNDVGYKDDICNPFYPLGEDFIVFPQVIMDSCILSKEKKWLEFLKICDITDKNDAILVINWHQRNFNENEFPGHSKFYEDMIIELKRQSAVFKTLSEYYTEEV